MDVHARRNLGSVMADQPKRVRVGDRILVEGWSPIEFEVVDISDRALVTVRSTAGKEFRVGRRAIARVLPRERGNE